MRDKLKDRARVRSARILTCVSLVVFVAVLAACHRHVKRGPEMMRREAIDFLAAGEELERQGEYGLAINKYLQALDLSPRPAVFYRLGHCYAEKGDYERAVIYLREATARAQDFRLAQLELEKAETLLQSQRKIAAVKQPAQAKEVALAEPSPAASTPAPAPHEQPVPAPVVLSETPSTRPAIPPTEKTGETAQPILTNTPAEQTATAPKEPAPEAAAAPSAATPAPSPAPPPAPRTPAPPPKPKQNLPSRDEVNAALFPSLYGKAENAKDESRSDLQFIKDREVFLGSFDYHRAKAESYAATKNYDEAIMEYQDALAFNPRSLESRLALADLYVKTERLERAEQSYRAALELFPNEPRIYFKLGNLYLQKRDYARAEINFQKTLGLDPRNKAAHNNLGVVYMNTGRYTEAAENFEDAVSIDPDYTDAWLNSGILHEKNLNDPKKALECYKKYVQLDGSRKEEVSDWIKEVESSLPR